MKLLAENLVAWFVIYAGLWVATGNWGLNITTDVWRFVILVVCLIFARMSARESGLRGW